MNTSTKTKTPGITASKESQKTGEAEMRPPTGCIFANVMMSEIGQIFVFDMQGQQVPELQKPPIILWAENAERVGYNVDGLTIQTFSGPIILHKTEDGWNFSTR